MALLFVILFLSLLNSKIIQCGSFQRSDAYELGESLLDQLSKTHKALLPDNHFDSKFECNYAFYWGVSLKSGDGAIFVEDKFFYQNNFKFNFLEDKVRDQISKHIKVNLTDTNRNGDEFLVEIYYVNDRNILCSDELKKNENSRNLLSNLNDVRKLAISLLDGIYNTGKPNWPNRHLDAKYECNYIFKLDIIYNKGTSNYAIINDNFYQKNFEFYQFDLFSSSILDDAYANNQLLFVKMNSKNLYSLNVYFLDNPSILCSDEQKLENRDKLYDRNAVHNLAISLLNSISNTKKYTVNFYPSTHFDAKYDCNYVFEFTMILNKPYKSIVNVDVLFYQKNRQFYPSYTSDKIIDKTSPNNQVKLSGVNSGGNYIVTIYFLDNPSILCPERSNQKYRSKLKKVGK